MPVVTLTPPEVETPDTFNSWEIKFVVLVTPKVVMPETLSWVTDAIPPITFVAIPALVA